MSERFSNVVRMWHEVDLGKWCHAWDVDEPSFRTWETGQVAMKASDILLPSGHSPSLGTRIVCGTCGSTDINPIRMKKEHIQRTSAREATKG